MISILFLLILIAIPLQFTFAGNGITFNCTGASLTVCKIRIKNGIDDFLTLKTYRQDTSPRINGNDPIVTTVQMSFQQVNNIDQYNGLMSITVSLLLMWDDELFTVDPASWASCSPAALASINNNGLLFNPKTVYLPEFRLGNGMGITNGGDIPDIGTVRWFPGVTGDYSTMVWKRSGIITFGCSFYLKDFPFDSQTCSAIYLNQISTRPTYILLEGDSPGVDVASSFTSLSWNVLGVDAVLNSITLQTYERETYNEVIWNIRIERFNVFYVITAVLPTIVITVISIGGLTNPDMNSRVALVVTGLLTIVALQFSITSGLPITSDISWLLGFSLDSLYFIAAVCAECAFIIFIAYRPKQKAPWFIQKLLLAHDYLWHISGLHTSKQIDFMLKQEKSGQEDNQEIGHPAGESRSARGVEFSKLSPREESSVVVNIDREISNLQDDSKSRYEAAPPQSTWFGQNSSAQASKKPPCRSVACGPNEPVSSTVIASDGQLHPMNNIEEDGTYNMYDFSEFVDLYIKMIIPIWYIYYITQNLPDGVFKSYSVKTKN